MTPTFTAPLSLNHHKPTLPYTTTHTTRIPISRRTPTAQTESQAAKPASFPKLYDAWFPPHELKHQMQTSLTRAILDNNTLIELQWPTVPNLEEIAAGTLLNFQFGKYVAQQLGMEAPSDYMLIKRYLAQFCNLYWAVAVAQSDAFASRRVWAVSTDGVSKTAAKNLGNLTVVNMRNLPVFGEHDVVVVLDPRANSVWERGVEMRPRYGATVFLNSQFSECYGLTGPRKRGMKDIVCAYFLKRVTRGYAFFAYPGPWRGILEKPDMTIEEVGRWDQEPSLRDLSRVVREESNRRYGGFYNDRYIRGFGGRL